MLNCGSFDYKMSKSMQKDILATRKGEDKKVSTQQYLIDYVNTQYNLLYRCNKVTVSL